MIFWSHTDWLILEDERALLACQDYFLVVVFHSTQISTGLHPIMLLLSR